MVLPPPRSSLSTLSIISLVDPTKGDNKSLPLPGSSKEALTIEREVETDDVEVSVSLPLTETKT